MKNYISIFDVGFALMIENFLKPDQYALIQRGSFTVAEANCNTAIRFYGQEGNTNPIG